MRYQACCRTRPLRPDKAPRKRWRRVGGGQRPTRTRLLATKHEWCNERRGKPTRATTINSYRTHTKHASGRPRSTRQKQHEKLHAAGFQYTLLTCAIDRCRRMRCSVGSTARGKKQHESRALPSFQYTLPLRAIDGCRRMRCCEGPVRHLRRPRLPVRIDSRN